MSKAALLKAINDARTSLNTIGNCVGDVRTVLQAVRDRILKGLKPIQFDDQTIYAFSYRQVSQLQDLVDSLIHYSTSEPTGSLGILNSPEVQKLSDRLEKLASAVSSVPEDSPTVSIAGILELIRAVKNSKTQAGRDAALGKLLELVP